MHESYRPIITYGVQATGQSLRKINRFSICMFVCSYKGEVVGRGQQNRIAIFHYQKRRRSRTPLTTMQMLSVHLSPYKTLTIAYSALQQLVFSLEKLK